MSARPLTIAVTGLNATDNPGPGVPVLRSLRDGARPGERRVGLTYDALDPGVYARDLADQVFLLPYPSAGAHAFLERLRSIHERAPLDVIIPTLDAELPLFIALEPQLRAMGIALFVPTREQLDLRAKAQLAALGRAAGIDVPETASSPASTTSRGSTERCGTRSSSRALTTARRSPPAATRRSPPTTVRSRPGACR